LSNRRDNKFSKNIHLGNLAMSPFSLNGQILAGAFAALCQTLIQKPPGQLPIIRGMVIWN